jgi:hypothetical protein
MLLPTRMVIHRVRTVTVDAAPDDGGETVPVLMWVALLVTAWCVASLAAAVGLGSYLRRRTEATDPQGALRPLDTGPLRLWLGDLPDVPATPEALTRRTAFDGLVAGLPSPRAGRDAAVRAAAP